MGSVFAFALILAPILYLLQYWGKAPPDIWQHLTQHLLLDISLNTLFLMFTVFAGTFVLGTLSGFLCGLCVFPGQKLFSKILIFPLAIPAYVFAFVFQDFFPNQTSAYLKTSITFILAFYPYVFLMSKAGFKNLSQSHFYAAKSLGHSTQKTFFKVLLPMSLPWILGGCFLVLMETLADFGTVSIFNYATFTTAIYSTWYSMFSLEAAAQLSLLLLLYVIALALLESHFSKRPNATSDSSRHTPINFHLSKTWGYSATLFLSSVFSMAFIYPCIKLVHLSLFAQESASQSNWFSLAGNTFIIAIITAMVICLLSICLVYFRRMHKNWISFWIVKIAGIGYAIPGTILAVAVYLFFTSTENLFLDFMEENLGITLPLLLSSSLVIVVAGLTIRFLSLGHRPIENALKQISPNLEESAQSLGHSKGSILKKVHFPLMLPGFGVAFTLILVESIKELPITLMTRPFGWNTFATHIFERTSEGHWEEAALPALSLVLIGILPILFLNKFTQND